MVTRRRTPHLIGREQPLRVLFDAVDEIDEQGRMLLLAGEAGIGKTRLLDEFARRAPDVRVARGGCIEGVAYAPWTDVLWWLTSSEVVDVDALPEQLRHQLGRLLPQLATSAPDDDERVGDQQMLFEAMVALLARAASGARLVVVVDDVHWIDPASRDLLRYVVANLRRLPLLFVIAYRPEDSAAHRDLLAHLVQLGSGELVLERLPSDATAEIASFLLAEASTQHDVARIVAEADGNPLFIEELVAAVTAVGVPETLRDLMLVRYHSLDDDARHLVRTAALIGPRAPRAWLAVAAELDDARALRATRASLETGVLDADLEVEGYAFRHALLRQAVLDELASDERVAIHAAIAEALEQLPDDLVGVDRAAELARHWDAAARPTAAVRALVAAARHARSRYAFDAAADAYDRALFWWSAADDPERVAGIDRAELLLRAADAAGAAGRVERAADLSELALDASLALGAERGADAAARVRALLWADDRHAVYASARAELEPRLDEVTPRTRAHFLVQSLEQRLVDGDVAGIEAAVAGMTQALERAGDVSLVANGHVALASYHEIRGDLERSDREYAQAIEAAVRGDDAILLTGTLYNYAAFCTSLPRLRECLARLDDYDVAAEQYGVQRYFIPAQCLRAYAHCELGELDAARAVLARIANHPAEGYDAWFRATIRAMVHVYAGEPEQALAALDPSAVGSPLPTDFERTIYLASWRALALCQMADVDAARAAVDAATPATERLRETFYQGALAPVAMRVEADAAVAATEARDLVALDHARSRAEAVATRWRSVVSQLERPHPLARARTAALDAEQARLEGTDVADAARRAAEGFDELEMPYYATYFRWRAAQAHLAEGRRSEANTVLRQAYTVARDRGFGKLSAVIESAARAHQLPLGPGRTTVDGDAPLSDRELEVLRLLADGRSNPEIAAALSISRHTARAHVSNILRKLDATTRAEAVAAAHRRGVV